MKSETQTQSALKVAMIGTGYVGLVTGTCLAILGHSVTCIDRDDAKIAALVTGRMPIYEPGLEDLVARGAGEGRLAFATSAKAALADAAIIFIAVGTPSAHDGDADLRYVFGAARDAATHMRADAILVVKSTVPVGTGDAVERIVRSVRPEFTGAVVSNPEFLREGSAIDDFLEPDRIVVGTEDPRAQAVMSRLYAPLAGKAPIVSTTRRTAELTKYAANSFLAVKITFINEMADLCEKAGADITDLAFGMGLDRRIGGAFLNPGPGYGGSCFPKDTLALLHSAQNVGVPLRVVEDAISANNARKRKMALRVAEAAGGSVDGATVAVLGLSFKANTDDMRDSPAVPLIQALQGSGATIRCYDPVAMARADEMLPGALMCKDAYDCAHGADVVVLVTDWEEFRHLDLGRLKAAMAGTAFVDLRNIVSKQAADRAGLRLSSIGRPLAAAPIVPPMGTLLPADGDRATRTAVLS